MIYSNRFTEKWIRRTSQSLHTGFHIVFLLHFQMDFVFVPAYFCGDKAKENKVSSNVILGKQLSVIKHD